MQEIICIYLQHFEHGAQSVTWPNLTNTNFFGWLMSYVGFLVGRSVKDIQRQATAPADALASTSKVSCGSCTHRAPTVHLLCTHRTWRAHHKRVELAGDLQLAFQIHIIEIYWDSSSVYTLSSSELPIWPWSTSMAFTNSDASSRVSSWHNAMAHRPGPWTLVCGTSNWESQWILIRAIRAILSSVVKWKRSQQIPTVIIIYYNLL